MSSSGNIEFWAKILSYLDFVLGAVFTGVSSFFVWITKSIHSLKKESAVLTSQFNAIHEDSREIKDQIKDLHHKVDKVNERLTQRASRSETPQSDPQ